ncbi:protein-glutamate O-methyltransferase CheR [Candidatus Bathyarchaeota archaeon]|nr:protein-glutamate O-methyltransferase CheR [Candidatus Bathyarchaeota archaeon]
MLRKHDKSSAERLDERAFNILKEAIFKATGLNCEYYRDSYLRRRINYRMRLLGIDSYWKYLQYLISHDDEYRFLLRGLTVNYSKFFRDYDVFMFFKDKILPSILSKKRFIRILSAGCASGEEPYTISIIINEALGPKISNFSISIYGVDIDERCLKKAIIGEYDAKELCGVPQNLIERYFLKTNGKLKVKGIIRRLVHFKNADLTQPLGYRNLDIIFCRNVLIYFDREGQIKLFNSFYNSLLEGGYLIIGKTEVLPEGIQGMFKCVSPEARVYQRV